MADLRDVESQQYGVSQYKIFKAKIATQRSENSFQRILKD